MLSTILLLSAQKRQNANENNSDNTETIDSASRDCRPAIAFYHLEDAGFLNEIASNFTVVSERVRIVEKFRQVFVFRP